MKLTEENYYSKEANQAYFSVSQYKDFLQCESMAMAKTNGLYEPPMTRAMLVGSFVDHHFEGTLPQFINEHSELFTRSKQLRAEFRHAYEIIRAIESNEKFMNYMSGEKQKILTFEMFGVPWKMKMDSFLPEICITDLKIIARTEWLWKWNYEIQGAIYQYGVEANGYGRLPFYLAIATKEKVPDLNIFQIPDSLLDETLLEIEANMPHFIAVKNGLEEPERCEKCPWCKMTRKLKVRDYRELMED